MQIDLDLYRREVLVKIQPDVRLSVVDVAPEYYQDTMMFLHGFGGNAMQWQYQLDAFAATHRVLAPDLRGHGLSDRPHSAYDMRELVGDIEAILDVLGITGKITLIGHSFGAALASEFATSRPKRVERLILVAGATKYRINPLYRTLLKFPEQFLNMVAPLVRKQLWAPPFVLKAMYRRAVAPWDGPTVYPQISAPALIIRGHNDRVFERPQFEQVPQLIHQSEDIDVGASGHMVMLERSDATNRAITRFLELEQRAWSGSENANQDAPRVALLKERPWLPYYDDGVPATISPPRASLPSLLNASARRFPFRSAVVLNNRSLSYRSLRRQVNRFAHALSQVGVQKGDRVLLMLPNLPQMVIAFYGAMKSGAVLVLTQPGSSQQALTLQFKETGAKVAICSPSSLSDIILAFEASLPDRPESTLHIVLADKNDYLPFSTRLKRLFQKRGTTEIERRPPSWVTVDNFRDFVRGKAKHEPEVEISPKDLAVIQYAVSSGVSLLGVMLTHRNLTSNVLQARHWMPGAVEGGERFLCVVPFFHSYGMTVGMNLSIAIGGTMILAEDFNTGELMRLIQRHQPTVFPGVPKIFMAIINFPEVRKYGIASIKFSISGSDALPVEIQETYEKITRSRLIEGYGLTEASPSTHMNPISGKRKTGSIGLPLPSTEARIVDLRTGQTQVPVGQIGELAVRGPQVMAGYWGDVEATQQVLRRDGWLLTGDIAQMDSEGYFRIVAKKADMWYPNQPDQPAFPRDVEEVLYEIPQVLEAAVVIVAGRPIAFVVSKKERPTSESLIAYCKRRLPPDLVPRLILFVDELPRSFLGRVLHRELEERISQSPEATDSASG